MGVTLTRKIIIYSVPVQYFNPRFSMLWPWPRPRTGALGALAEILGL